MKIVLILVGVILSAFVVIQLFAFKSSNKIETYPYVVNKKYKAFEIRTYDAALFTTVKLSSNKYKTESSRGFSILAGYIFGKNEKSQKIAMTSPVSMSLEDSMTMMFMVPKKFNKESLPEPKNSQIEFKQEPKKTVAAIRFGGWANDKKIEKYKQKLIMALKKEGIRDTNKFFFLGYNPPYEVFNRRNEIIVVLEK